MSIKIENIKGNIKISESLEPHRFIVYLSYIFAFIFIGVPVSLMGLMAAEVLTEGDVLMDVVLNEVTDRFGDSTFYPYFFVLFVLSFIAFVIRVAFNSFKFEGRAGYVLLNGKDQSIEICQQTIDNWKVLPLQTHRLVIINRDVDYVKIETDLDFTKWNPSPIFFPNLMLGSKEQKAIKFLSSKNKSEAIDIVKVMANFIGVKSYDVSGEEFPAS